MTKTDNLVERETRRLGNHLSNAHDKLLDHYPSEEYFDEIRKLDVGFTARLSRRPLSPMEINTVSKKAEKQITAITLREKKRGSNSNRRSLGKPGTVHGQEPTGTPAP